jgi:hypothetical protein
MQSLRRFGSLFSFVPGPTCVSPEALKIYGSDFGSPDLSDAFFATYRQCTERLASMLDVEQSGSAIIMSGEAMVGLWGSVKSVVRPGDRVACLSNGLFGTGFVDIARAAGGDVTLLEGLLCSFLFLFRFVFRISRKAIGVNRSTLVVSSDFLSKVLEQDW